MLAAKKISQGTSIIQSVKFFVICPHWHFYHREPEIFQGCSIDFPVSTNLYEPRSQSSHKNVNSITAVWGSKGWLTVRNWNQPVNARCKDLNIVKHQSQVVMYSFANVCIVKFSQNGVVRTPSEALGWQTQQSKLHWIRIACLLLPGRPSAPPS